MGRNNPEMKFDHGNFNFIIFTKKDLKQLKMNSNKLIVMVMAFSVGRK